MKTILLPAAFFLYIFAEKDFYDKLSDAAIGLTATKVTSDSRYFSIDYPVGDLPKDKGVCTDVVIRAYRKHGIDLQKQVHQDIKRNFNLYPKIWNLKSTDRNIDHRRVPNLQSIFYAPRTKTNRDAKSIRLQNGDLVTCSSIR